MSTWKKVIAVAVTIISLLLFSVNIFGQATMKTPANVYTPEYGFEYFAVGYGGTKGASLVNCKEILAFDMPQTSVMGSPRNTSTSTSGDVQITGKSIVFSQFTFAENPTLPKVASGEYTWELGATFRYSNSLSNATADRIQFFTNAIYFGQYLIYDGYTWIHPISHELTSAPTFDAVNQNGVLYTDFSAFAQVNKNCTFKVANYTVANGISYFTPSTVKTMHTTQTYGTDDTSRATNRWYLPNYYAHSTTWVNFSMFNPHGYIYDWNNRAWDYDFVIGAPASLTGYVDGSFVINYKMAVLVVDKEATGTAIKNTPKVIWITGTYKDVDNGKAFMSGNRMRIQLFPREVVKQRILQETGQELGGDYSTVNVLTHEVNGYYQTNGAGEMNFRIITTGDYIISTDSLWLREQVGSSYLTNETQGFNFISWVGATIDDFFSIELFGLFSIGDILTAILAASVLFMIIKLFMGG